MMVGYDLELIQKKSSGVSIPLIAMGGAGILSDLYNAFYITSVSALSVSSLFNFTDQSPIKVNFYLKFENIDFR